MPGTDARHLPQTTMRLARKLLCVPTAGDTWDTVTLGDPDDVDHLVLGEDRVDGDGLLQLLAGPVHLVRDGAAVELHLHQVRLLLPDGQQLMNANLCVGDDADDLTILLHQVKVLLQLLLALIVLPLLAVFGKSLLLGLVPVILVEAALALVADVFSKDGLKGTETTGGVDVTHDPDHDHGRGLHDGDGLHHLLLAHHHISTLKLSQEGRHVHGFAGIILGEALGFASVSAAPLAGQKPQRSVAWSRKFAVGLRETGKLFSRRSKWKLAFKFTSDVSSVNLQQFIVFWF
uniref:Uncharacterized protein n=1 Tax=Takifugu rubripes TaxID=31033 RepID=A0A3B5KN74_TAKRU